jgi:hypothetical protein
VNGLEARNNRIRIVPPVSSIPPTNPVGFHVTSARRSRQISVMEPEDSIFFAIAVVRFHCSDGLVSTSLKN